MGNQGFYGFPGRQPETAPSFAATLVSAVGAGARFVGGTSGGAPASGGPFRVRDFVIDDSAAIWVCTAAGSPGTWGQVGTLVDPLTTRGDLLVRGASSTTRLALGTTNYVLTSNGTDAVWGVAPANAGGALTQIAQTVLSGSAASITFSSIPGTYSSLHVACVGRSDEAAAASSLVCQFNSDTGANYDWQELHGFSTSPACSESRAQTSTKLGFIPAASAPSGLGTSLTAAIIAYAGTTFQKCVLSRDNVKWGTSAGNMQNDVFAGHWRSTAAVTTLTLFSASGNLVAGTVATLYGLS